MEKTDTFYNTGCKLFKGASEQEYPDEPRRLYGESTGAFRLSHIPKCVRQQRSRMRRAAFYGVQYHPEVNHTENGTLMLKNFLYEVRRQRRLDDGGL